ncbi:MAG: hypothetical protein Q7S00_00145 [bacterium]|nr:hypothetical protein [bacterium]
MRPIVRWAKGMRHHPFSETLYDQLAKIDLEENDDYFCWKSGGDGDNGETFMFLLDELIERGLIPIPGVV